MSWVPRATSVSSSVSYSTRQADALQTRGYVIVPATTDAPHLFANASSWLAGNPQQLALDELRLRKRQPLTVDGEHAVRSVMHTTACRWGLTVPGLEFDGVYGIVNKPPRPEDDPGADLQGLHTDYAAVAVERFRGGPLFPRSAIWAAFAEFDLLCAPYPLTCDPRYADTRLVNVKHGSVIFFMGDFWHGGGPFASEMPRFHAFQKSSSLMVPSAIYS